MFVGRFVGLGAVVGDGVPIPVVGPGFDGSFSSSALGAREIESSVGIVVGSPEDSERLGDMLLLGSICVGDIVSGPRSAGEGVSAAVGVPPTVLGVPPDP